MLVLLRGVKRSPRPQAHSRLPITLDILSTVKAQWSGQAGDMDIVMLWAECCLFFGFLRAGEFTAKSAREFDTSESLMLDDVAVPRHNDPSTVKIRLKSSMTNPFHHSIDVFLGRTHRTSVRF